MYTSGLQAPSSTPAATFAATLHTALLAGGLEFVETWISGSNTAGIYKSPAASNTFGQDWYLNTVRGTDASTSIWLGVAEVWDTGTKKLRNYALLGATRTPTASFAINDATGLSPATLTNAGCSAFLAAAGFQYWISANPDRVVVATRVGATDYGVYAGLYDDVLPPAISPFPLCAVKLLDDGAAGAGQGGATREPGATTSTANAFGVYVNSSTSSPHTTAAGVYAPSPVIGRAVLHTSRLNISGAAFAAKTMRGYLKGVAFLSPAAGAAAFVNGDTLTVTEPRSGDVRTYTAMGATPAYYWADQGV